MIMEKKLYYLYFPLVRVFTKDGLVSSHKNCYQ